MTDYKAIHGKNIQSLASDLGAEGEGQIWFNTTSGDYKTIVKVAGAWATSPAMNTARYDFGSANSSPSSTGLTIGGHPTTHKSIVEKYDGTSWTEVGDLNSGRKQAGGFGISTAAALVGGSQPGGPKRLQETWDGSSWSEAADLTVGADAANNNACGTTTAALFIGGARELTPPLNDSVESWNGTSWSEIADLVGSGAQYATCFGITTAALCVGGSRPCKSADAEEFDGSSWTEVGNTNDARDGMGGGGTTDFGIVWGGVSPGIVATTEIWDGTSWTEVADLATARGYMGGNGVASSAIAVGGTPPTVANVEEWSFTSTLAAGAWASGGAMNTARSGIGYASQGTQDAALGFAGYYEPGLSALVEEYDGSSWSEEADINTARRHVSGTGTVTAALCWCGIPPGGSASQINELYDGSSWTEVGDTNTAAQQRGAGGTTTAAITMGGNPATVNCELWNGTSWTETANLNTGRQNAPTSMGVQTSTFQVSGANPGGTAIANVEEWDGSSWTETTDVNTARKSITTAGTTALALVFGGSPDGSSSLAITEYWDGSSWTELADLSTARFASGGSGTTLAALNFAGTVGATQQSVTEEWTVPQNIKVIDD